MNSPMNLLIVDDQHENLVALESILSRSGYELTLVTSAQDALMALMQKEFALIILDVEMPVMNGLELASVVKKRHRTADIPIIFVTAHQRERDILSGYVAGAVDYVTKPVNPGILQSKVAVFADLCCKNRALLSANDALQREIADRRSVEIKLAMQGEELARRLHHQTDQHPDVSQRAGSLDTYGVVDVAPPSHLCKISSSRRSLSPRRAPGARRVAR